MNASNALTVAAIAQELELAVDRECVDEAHTLILDENTVCWTSQSLVM